MSGAQLMLDRCGAAADPYLTLVGYFNATRELAGMARFMGRHPDGARQGSRPGPGCRGARARHTGHSTSTSSPRACPAKGSPTPWTGCGSPSTRTSTAPRHAERGSRPASARNASPSGRSSPTMRSWPVDAPGRRRRLPARPHAHGGQPKNTAEYIQASLAGRPGWQSPRPDRHPRQLGPARDLAHYEQFRHYHETFYAQVEALSVTPFSATCSNEGWTACSSAPPGSWTPRADGLSQEKSAGRIGQARASVEALIEHLVARVRRASDDDSATAARSRLLNRLDQWEQRRSVIAQKRACPWPMSGSRTPACMGR